MRGKDKRVWEQGNGDIIVTIIVAIIILFLMVVGAQLATTAASHKRLADVTRIAMLQMENAGGLTPAIESMIRTELTTIGDDPADIEITGTPAVQKYGTRLELEIIVPRTLADYTFVNISITASTRAGNLSARKVGYSVYNADNVAEGSDPGGGGEDTTPELPGVELGITITSPTDGALVNGFVTISTATTGSVQRTEFFLDGKHFATDYSRPYSAVWDTATSTEDGVYVISAKAYDYDGNVAASQLVAVNLRTPSDLIVASGQSFTLQGGTYQYRNVEIRGTLYVNHVVRIRADNFTVFSGGSVNGYARGTSGTGNAWTSGGGSGYGNPGGATVEIARGWDIDGGSAYGTTSGWDVDEGSGPGGAGFEVRATNIQVQGSIAMQGEAGLDCQDGGGSGGCILLYGRIVNITGQLNASGGSANSTYGGGGGGGGRIKLFGETITCTTSNYSVYGGAGATGTEYNSSKSGSTGTFWQEHLAYNPVPPLDTASPAVSVTYPTSNLALNGVVMLLADASDAASGVQRVQFELDGERLGDVRTSPYQYLWDSSYVSDGVHSLRAMAVDNAGNIGYSAPVAVYISHTSADTTPPTLVVTSPTDGSYVKGASVPLTVDVADGETGVSHVEYYLDGALYATVYLPPWGATWKTSTLAEGSHPFEVRAYDYAGNMAQASGVTYYDKTVPAVGLSAPASNAKLSGTVTVTATGSDNIRLAEIAVTANGMEICSSPSSPLSYQWDTSSLADGSYSLVATATDAAGNTTSTTARTVYVDNTPPTVQFTAPLDGAAIKGTSYTLTATAADANGVSSVAFYMDGTLLTTDTTSPYSYTINTTSYAAGGHSLVARASDPYGNKTDATSNIIIDNTAPTMTIVSPVSGSTVSGHVRIVPDARDQFGIDHYDLAANGAPAGTTPGDADYLLWDASGMADGPCTLTVTAYDRAGNSVAKSLSVNVTGSQALFEDFEDDTLVYSFTLSPSSEFGAYDDTFAPAGLRSFRTLNVSYYAGQEWYAGTTVNLSNPGQVTFLYNVNGTTSDSLRFYIDGVLQFTVKGSSTTTATRFTAPLTAASHLLEWRYIWNSSYSNSAMGCRLDNLLVSQAIPNASPTAAFSLSDSTYISGEYLNVIQESSDPDDATLDYAWAVWNKSLYQSPTWVNAGTDPSGPDPASYLQPASYSLQLTVYDALRASNSTTRDFTVTADTKPPAMAITSPANGTQATGTVNVSATASDPNGIKQVDFKIDGVLQATASVPAYSFAWDTTTVPEGSHTITVDAYDTKDNKATQTVTVLVDRTSPQLVLTSPGDQAYVRGLVTVTATASDANGVTRVEFYYDGVLSQTVAAAPYTATWDTSVLTGAHTLAAKAYDLAGNVTATAARTVYVDNTPPTVGLTTPANLGAVSGPTTLTATATDDVSGVTQVEFFVDGWSVGVATSSPYSSTYDFDQLTPGAFQVKAVATDRSGNTAETTVMVTHHAIYEDFEDTTYQIAWAYNSWVRSTVTPYAGVGCFKSGTTAASTSTYVRTPSYSFPNGGKVTFRYRVSSRAGDVFSFRWGTTTKLSFGGIQDWTFYAIDVPAGTTTDLRFFYTKDASGVSGEDAAYIDDLVIQINP